MFKGKTKLGVEVGRLRGVPPPTKDRQWIVVLDRAHFRVFARQEGLIHEILSVEDLHREQDLVRRGISYLEKARRNDEFDSLQVYAESHTLGRVRALMSKQTIALVERFLEKDFAWLTRSEIERRLAG